MAQSVKRPALAQVMMSQSVSSSPASGSVLIARSLKPALDSVSPSLSASPLLMLCLSVSKIKTFKKFKVSSQGPIRKWTCGLAPGTVWLKMCQKKMLLLEP